MIVYLVFSILFWAVIGATLVFYIAGLSFLAAFAGAVVSLTLSLMFAIRAGATRIQGDLDNPMEDWGD